MTFNIPETIDGAAASLADLEGLITARSWQRAAIVYAFTDISDTGGRPTSGSLSSETLSVSDFAALGIQGLRSAQTVRTYHGHWQCAVDEGKAQPVRPGENVTEPDLPFPPNPDSEGGTDRSFKTALRRNPEKARGLIEDPEVAPIIEQAVAQSPASMARVNKQASGRLPSPEPNPEPLPNDVDAEGSRIKQHVINVRRDVEALIPRMEPDQRSRWFAQWRSCWNEIDVLMDLGDLEGVES